VLGITAKIRPGEQVQVINVNGAPDLGLFDSDGLTAVVSLTVSSDRITRVDLIRAPGKLLRLSAPPRRVALRAGDDVFCRLHNRLA
jgi:RNA polymerase sigma-70 factor (ECF subfamily)